MAPRVDRKLAAILAADVVGYSRLVGDDEAGTIARLKGLRKELIEPLIAEHRGRVVKLMGDGALVEFASAVDAVECAVAVQRGVAEREAAVPGNRRIAFRIGVNIGDIIVEDGDILGDGVNVAARLEGLAEPGEICVARNVYNQVKAKLDLAFEPTGEHRVKNIAEPITVYRVNLDAPGRAPRRRPLWAQRRWQTAVAVVLLLALGAGGAWYALRPQAPPPDATTAKGAVALAPAEAKPALPLPNKPSIAVLPFDNLSGDPKQERLAGGLTEDIITDLARFRELFVIARNSSFVYEDRPTDIRQIARQLGVQYVLEGSLQTDDNQVRITAQLIDATTGNHVWSERYDRPLDDVFAIQDGVTRAIANSIGTAHGVIDAAGREETRRKLPESLQAYDYYLLGKEHQQRFTEEENGKAEELLMKAIELSPGFARAYVSLSFTYINAYENGWHRPREESRAKWLEAATTAAALDSLDGYARIPLAWYHWYTSDFARALPEFESAINLNPNDADVLALSAVALPWLGKPEQAVELLERAMRLNPHFPDWYLGMARDVYFYAGQFEKSLAASRQRKTPAIFDALTQPLAYAQLGRDQDAAALVAKFLEREPDYSAEQWLSDTGQFARETQLNLFLDSNLKAGLPVCATEAQLSKYPDMKRLEQCEQQRASG